MRIYTKSGDLAFKTFTFPDGQPHFKLETYERDFDSVTIETALKSPLDLLALMLANDVLRQHGYSEVNLDVRYLLGARMDRAISWAEPFTLQSIAKLINSCGFTRVRVLDAHSEVATRLIRNSSNVLPYGVVQQVRATLGFPSIVCPDKGARQRVSDLCGGYDVRCEKARDMATGALTGFHVDVPHPADKYAPFEALIVDDICDGGGTFVGLAKELRAKGATKVSLFVTHGIFSKGLPLEGIDKIFTTNSYCPYATGREFKGTVVIPVSMKEMK
jgi:ribose-phosphate pyrophosphokinase